MSDFTERNEAIAFFPADFRRPADFLPLPHIGTLARLINKYPAYQLLGKKTLLLALLLRQAVQRPPAGAMNAVALNKNM